MLGRIREWFGKDRDRAAATLAAAAPVVEMIWRNGPSRPIPEWEAIAAQEAPEWSDPERDAFWSAAAASWLSRTAEDLGRGYRVSESARFLMLSALPERATGLFLASCESSRKRILRFLEGIASDRRDGGKHVVIVLDDQDDYYDYVSNFHGEGGEYAMSSGMFIHAGYGHFVLWSDDMRVAESTIAHELTHCLLADLSLPTWLDEGMAVNIERRIFPHLAHPDMQEYPPSEMQARHARFWNRETIQAFWSGTLFMHAGEGSALAYDLATRITSLAGRDYPAFSAFVFQAGRDDAGLASEELLGYPLASLAEAVLGPGDWAPDPSRWDEPRAVRAASGA